jgi:hypothetical protein
MEQIRRNIEVDQIDVNGIIVKIRSVLPGVLHENFPGHDSLNNDDLVSMILAYNLFKIIENPLERQMATRWNPPPNHDIIEALQSIIGPMDRYHLFGPDDDHTYVQASRLEVQRYNGEQLLLARERLSMATGTLELADAEGVGEDISRRILGELGTIPQQQINQSLLRTRPLRGARERLRRAVIAQNMAGDRNRNTVLGQDVSGRILDEIGQQTPNEQFPRGEVPGLRRQCPASSSSSIMSSEGLARLDAEIAAMSSGDGGMDQVDGGSLKLKKKRPKRSKRSKKNNKRSKSKRSNRRSKR